MKIWLGLVVALAACGGSREAKKVCEQAGEKYATCVQEMLGPEMAAMARGKDGVAACARDDKTVAMYKKCLPEADCTKFMDCLEGTARDAQPEIPAGPRKQQCEQHVKDGLRGIAMQVVVINEIVKRDDAAKGIAQECTLDEAKPWADCLEPAERDEVARYGVQRQTECEAWAPELAACVLRQPGAKNCDPDSFPLWRTPREQGPPGPKVAWSIEAAYDDEDYSEDAFLGWGANHTLVVKDHNRIRGLRDGKVAWQKEDRSKHFAIAGASIVARPSEGTGLTIWDVATGTVTRAVAGNTIDGFGVAGDRVLAQTGDNELHEVMPAKCAKPSCAKKLATLPEEWSYSVDTVGAWRGDLVIESTSSSSIVIVDRRAKQKSVIRLNEPSDIVLAGDTVILGDDKGVAILSLPACTKQGAAVYLPSTRYAGDDADLPEDCPTCVLAKPGCVTAHVEVSWIATVTPVPVPGGTAFNDHGIIGKTSYLGADGTTWSTITDGHGEVAGDDAHIYTASLGPDGDGPVQVIALDRATGKVAWQTLLEVKPPEHADASIAVREGLLAVQVGPKVYVLALPK